MGKKIYFVSDFHLGVDALLSSKDREKKIVRWLTSIEDDVFDYWYEYKEAVPKGFTYLLGKLAQMREKGIPIFFFTGNHDMWMFTYFEEEFGIPTYRNPIVKSLLGKTFMIGHGDGLGPGDRGYKFIKKIFSNSVCQWLFRWIHPDLGLKIMQLFSKKSRTYTGDEAPFSDVNQEWLVLFCEEDIQKNEIDFYIFGHRHLPINYLLSNGHSKYINLGEFIYGM